MRTSADQAVSGIRPRTYSCVMTTMATNPSEFLSDVKMFREKSSAFRHENALQKTRYLSYAKMFCQSSTLFWRENDRETFRLCVLRKCFEKMMSFPDAKILWTKDIFLTCENVLDKCYLSTMQKSFEEMMSFPDMKILGRKDVFSGATMLWENHAFPRRANVLGTGFLCPPLKCLGQWLVFPFLIVT